MSVHKVCHDFFRYALASFHKYRQSALTDATVALVNGASLTLTSIGRFLPGKAQVKNKIKRIDRLLGNELLQKDIPMIFKNIIAMLTNNLSLCVIAVDWSGYPSQEYHVLRASLICDGRSIPLLSQIVPSSQQNNSEIQKEFLNALTEMIKPEAKVVVITDAGFKNAWFNHIKSLGWEFVGRIRGNIQLQLNNKDEEWLRIGELTASDRPEYLGVGTLSKSNQCEGHFYLQKTKYKGRKHKRARCRIRRSKQIRSGRSAAKDPWLIFTSTDEFKPREVMKLYSRRMQIEQNFRDEKSERFGFGLRASYTRSSGRILVLSLLATLSTIVLWLLGYYLESKELHLKYQANSIKHRRVISYLTLAKNVLRHSPLEIKRISLANVLNKLTKTYHNMVFIY